MPDRVKNPLPPPEQCDACASFDVIFTGNERLYGKPYGEWPYCYLCLACGAAVGCHPNTRFPLGRMADKATRQMRAAAHRHFDPLWKSQAMTRTEAYKMLAKHLSIPLEQCHISQLNIEQLKLVIDQCKGLEISEAQVEVLKRRREKKDAKRLKRIKRESRQSNRHGKYTKRNDSARRARRREQDSSED